MIPPLNCSWSSFQSRPMKNLKDIKKACDNYSLISFTANGFPLLRIGTKHDLDLSLKVPLPRLAPIISHNKVCASGFRLGGASEFRPNPNSSPYQDVLAGVAPTYFPTRAPSYHDHA